MTPLDYAGRGWPVFPCHEKKPLVRWQAAATCDEQQIRQLLRCWPLAQIGVATGTASGIVVLDIDVKDDRADGWDTLDALGKSILPETPMAHTPSGGTHVYFATSAGIDIRNSIGKHGLGPGLDVRGTGGYVVAPSEGSGYWWDPHYNLDTVPLVSAPAWLGHREKAPAPKAKPGSRRFDPYTVLDEACDNIRNAGDGDKYRRVRREPFIVACLVRDGFLKEAEARHLLEAALLSLGRRVKDYQHMTKAYEGAFAEGLGAPSTARGKRR